MYNMFKVNNKDTNPKPNDARCRSGVFVNFGYISHFALVFLLLTLNM